MTTSTSGWRVYYNNYKYQRFTSLLQWLQASAVGDENGVYFKTTLYEFWKSTGRRAQTKALISSGARSKHCVNSMLHRKTGPRVALARCLLIQLSPRRHKLSSPKLLLQMWGVLFWLSRSFFLQILARNQMLKSIKSRACHGQYSIFATWVWLSHKFMF